MARKIEFSFLTAGPIFGLELPDDFEPVPETSSPLTIDNGHGHRSYDFVPAAFEPAISEDNRLLRKMADREGRTVEFYERPEDPPQWYLRWLLSNGALYTHLREAEGPEWAPIIVANLTIVERGGMPPVLLPEPPLGRGASSRAGYHERATFASNRGNDWAVTLRRPGFLPRGKVMRDPDNARVTLRGGAPREIDVEVLAGKDLSAGTELMSTVLRTLTPS